MPATDNSNPRVAFVGLGNMGGPMAVNVVRAGFVTVVSDLDQIKVDALVSEGATAATNAVEAVTDADIVLTSLPGPPQVQAVGAEILPAMTADSIWVDLSTNDLACSAALERLAADHQVHLLDGPVTGGAEGAEAGTLTVLVGGDATIHARCVPVFAAIGNRFDLLGPHGAGYVAKISQVMLCYLNTVCLSEALMLGVKGGVDPDKMLDIVRNSTGRSYVADRYGPEILNGGYDDTFDLGLAAKDLRLAVDLAANVGAKLPFTADVAAFYDQAETEYGFSAPHLIAMQKIETANDLIFHKHDKSNHDGTAQ